MASLKTSSAGKQRITPFLWFDNQAEEAMNLYLSIFDNSTSKNVRKWSAGGPAAAETVMSATFEIDGVEFTAFNGGPHFKFTPAISLFVLCENQQEVDHYWNAFITSGGTESQCGWLTDKFGVSWQIVPKALGELLAHPDRKKAERVMKAMMAMKKIEVPVLEAAANS